MRWFLMILVVIFEMAVLPGGWQAVHSQTGRLPLKLEDVGAPMPSTCGCNDLSNMRRRRAEAQVALGALGTLKIASALRNNDRPMEPSLYQSIQTTVNREVTSARYSEPSTGLTNLPGMTTPSVTRGDCQVKITPTASSCMNDALLTHEAPHLNLCYLMGGLSRNVYSTSPLYPLNLPEDTYLEKEANGYQAEVDFLGPEIRRLEGVCSGQIVQPAPKVDLQKINDLSILNELSIER